MKKVLLFITLTVMMLTFTGLSFGGQGRMAGMNDPHGLIRDGSDFLIHPALIAKEKNTTIYGHYRFTYNDVSDWDWNWYIDNAAGTATMKLPRRTSGNEKTHDSFLGATLPLGAGQLGVFVNYTNHRSDLHGNQEEWFLPTSNAQFYDDYDLISKSDEVALRLLFGLPLGGCHIGGEIGFSYGRDEKELRFLEDFGGGNYWLHINSPWGLFGPGGGTNWREFLFFMLPYDDEYYQTDLKGSLAYSIGPVAVELTVWGGYIFSGDNEYDLSLEIPPGTTVQEANLSGDRDGWNVGGEIWLRYPLNADLELPFVVRIDYEKKKRDGDGEGELGIDGWDLSYENNESYLQIGAGGGINKRCNPSTQIAAGIYYDYIKSEEDLRFTTDIGTFWFDEDHASFPDITEHRVTLKMAAEKKWSESLSFHTGLDLYYGRVKKDFEYDFQSNIIPNGFQDHMLKGSRWGLSLSFGCMVKMASMTVEPFVIGGFQRLSLRGDGDTEFNSIQVNTQKMDESRTDYFISAGFSVLFDL
jgi:hypothetical protein